MHSSSMHVAYPTILGRVMLGYTKEDLDNMSMAIHSVITTVDFNNDPWLHDHLYKATEFLDGLWAEGYFD